MIEIKHRWKEEIIFHSETATTIKEALKEAVKEKKVLRNADLSYADLSGAYLRGAYLGGADWRCS